MNSTSNSTAIRNGKLQDIAALKRCIDRAYAPVKACLNDLPDVSAGLDDDIATRTVLVAETGGKVSGCAILSFGDGMAHLMNIAVDPDFMGQGLGKLLIGKVEELARKRGANCIRLQHMSPCLKTSPYTLTLVGVRH